MALSLEPRGPGSGCHNRRSSAWHGPIGHGIVAELVSSCQSESERLRQMTDQIQKFRTSRVFWWSESVLSPETAMARMTQLRFLELHWYPIGIASTGHPRFGPSVSPFSAYLYSCRTSFASPTGMGGPQIGDQKTTDFDGEGPKHPTGALVLLGKIWYVFGQINDMFISESMNIF